MTQEQIRANRLASYVMALCEAQDSPSEAQWATLQKLAETYLTRFPVIDDVDAGA